ncbi:MAG: 3-deoxy-D-manno-octulosonic acid transferase, partial [Paracoccaceae bacterium]
MLVYRFVLWLIAPFLALILLIRLAGGRETRRGLGERCGRPDAGRAHHRGIWLHGASLGELTSARPLIEALLDRHPELHVIATANTYPARDMVQGWGLSRLSVAIAPLDYRGFVRRFLRHWRPVAMIVLENEIWPVRFATCADNGCPVLLVAARMSARSAANWRRFAALGSRVADSIDALWPLDAASGAQFARLGLDGARIHAPVNLKSSVRLASPAAGDLSAINRIWPRQNTVLAASVHLQEADTILRGFATALAARPALRLILAPRHLRYADRIAARAKALSLVVSKRSERPAPSINNTVYLADSIGEMALWYSAAKITVVGGSFAPIGGHTPFEPVQFASLVVHGPDTSKQAEAYTALHRADAAFQVADADGLAQ